MKTKKLFSASILVLVIAAAAALPVFSQAFSGVAYVEELSGKSWATFGDAVTFTVMIAGGKPVNFETNLAFLKSKSLLGDEAYKADNPLKRGDAAYILARLLKLDDSLIYNFFPTKRYSLAACKAAGIITGSGGPGAEVSGGELIDIMSAASRILETKSGSAEAAE